MEIPEMSRKEQRRHGVLKRLCSGKLSQQAAAVELQLSTRQMRRLERAYADEGAHALVSKQRGKPSNHQLAPKLKRLVVSLIQTRYPDFGPTLAHEKLAELHGLSLSLEAVRQLMIAHRLWQPRKARRVALHPLRERRPRCGELIQIDGSPHAWFEGRAPRCTLIVFIDDATSQLQQLRLVPAETTFAYFHVLHDYIAAFGKPVALYSDKFGVFRVNQPYLSKAAGQTQFGRAMGELDIELICANSPQAKGRVERANLTLQDRLVKELRLRGIADLDTANAYLPQFVAVFNRKFAVVPQAEQDAHRPLNRHEDLARILTLQSARTLSKNLTLQYERVLYQITAAMPSYRLRHQKVIVRENEAREVTIALRGKLLPYRIYHRAPKQGAVLSAKEVRAPRWPPVTDTPTPPTAKPPSATARTGRTDARAAPNDSLQAARAKPHEQRAAEPRHPYIPPPDSAWRKRIHAEIQEALNKKTARQHTRLTSTAPTPASPR